MDKLTKTFIKNAGKATQKKEIWFDAYTGKRVKSGDELDITFSEVCLVIAIISALGFITHIALGG